MIDYAFRIHVRDQFEEFIQQGGSLSTAIAILDDLSDELYERACPVAQRHDEDEDDDIAGGPA